MPSNRTRCTHSKTVSLLSVGSLQSGLLLLFTIPAPSSVTTTTVEAEAQAKATTTVVKEGGLHSEDLMLTCECAGNRGMTVRPTATEMSGWRVKRPGGQLAAAVDHCLGRDDQGDEDRRRLPSQIPPHTLIHKTKEMK